MNNTALVDKAINYAVLHHKDVFRKGKNVPYILHPLEAMSIVASITDDHELMAAAALHDLIEDT
ncbi:MAG: HD domain-containing protein, partial [Acholeplasmatales bacterium]|nr:HD domain-containing protein [Acholeplasmatales bacterium]